MPDIINRIIEGPNHFIFHDRVFPTCFGKYSEGMIISMQLEIHLRQNYCNIYNIQLISDFYSSMDMHNSPRVFIRTGLMLSTEL